MGFAGDFLIAFFAVFFLLALVVGPIFGAEDRPAVRWPDRKPRRMV
jgi:hypothetical protein